jgi:hypothetical protein
MQAPKLIRILEKLIKEHGSHIDVMTFTSELDIYDGCVELGSINLEEYEDLEE